MIGVQEMINFRDDSKAIHSKTTSSKRLDFKCAAPFREIVIRYDGTILPCCTFLAEKMPMGNINDLSIEEIWNNKLLKQLQKIHKEGRYYENPHCKQCIEGYES